jgi:hypothetical protein
MKIRAGKIRILGCAVLAVVLWLGCGAFMPRHRKGGMACSKDTDCRLGFCDRDVCVEPSRVSNYGAVCDSRPPAVTPEPGRPDPQCGVFLCLEGRCRSCSTDAECQSYFGAGKCDFNPASSYGFSVACSLPSSELQHRDRSAEWTGSLPCANVGPDVPVDLRLPAGTACLRDCDCRSGFCDRGTCADSADIGVWDYGNGWCEPGPAIAPSDVIVGSQGSDALSCIGYVCVDHRCRSCVSDEECQLGSRPYMCLPLYGLPGKRCGWPGEAKLGPVLHRMGPPPTGSRAPTPPDKHLGPDE